VHVLVAEEGDDIRAQLTAWGGTQYDLTGPREAELADVGFDDVQIQGTIIAQVGERHWQVEVTDWETAPQRQPQCLVGTFTLDGDDGWLVTDDGERYRLPNSPDGRAARRGRRPALVVHHLAAYVRRGRLRRQQ
jgi:hypothetical protein